MEVASPDAFSQPTTDKSNSNENKQKLNFFIGFDRLALLPGHPVTGVIYLSVKEKVIIKRLGINWFGLESVSWFQGYLQDEHCKNTRWWLKHRQYLFPEEGAEDQKAKEFLPGTYKYPFTWTLPESLPGSFEDDRSWTKVVFDDNFGLKTLDTQRMSFIRYTCTAFITEQNHLDNDENALMITVEDKDTVITHVVSKDFRVSEVYDPQILVGLVARKPVEELFLGDPLRVVLSVGNDGNILMAAPLHLRIDVHNLTRFNVNSMKLSILEKKAFTCVGPKGSVEVFARTTDVYSVDVKDGEITAGTTFDKIVKLVPPKGEPWGPSVLGGANVTLTHEVSLQIYIMASVVEVSLPIRICEYSSFFSKNFPKHIPHAIEAPDFGKLFIGKSGAVVGKSLDDLQAQDAHKQSSASSTTNAETSWFSSIWGTTSAVTTEASSTQEKTPEQSNVSWFSDWFSKQTAPTEKPYSDEGKTSS